MSIDGNSNGMITCHRLYKCSLTEELPKSLPRGGWIELPIEQVNYLRQLAGLEPETRTMLAADKHSVARAQVKSAKIRRAVRKHKVTATPKAKPTRQRS